MQEGGNCPDCGVGTIVTGFEFVESYPWREPVDWCDNVECPSNSAFRAFHRIGPHTYRCDVCDLKIEAFVGRLREHRSSHGE